MPDYKILTFLDNHFAATQTLKAWYDSNLATMTPADIDKYILDSYLMQLYNDQKKVEDIKSQYLNWLNAITAQIPPVVQPEPQPATEAVLQESKLQTYTTNDGVVHTGNFYPQETVDKISTQLAETFPENVQESTPAVYKDDAISNLSLMRELESTVMEQLNKIALLKEPYLHENNYVNDSYKFCPSFKNLIEPVQNAIISKRILKSNEKWFEKYRPELVEEILFPNTTIKETINEYVSKGRIAGNCMFYGTGGVGKTTTNIVLMNAVLKNSADRFFLDRKIESVDALKGWITKKPIGTQKIVIAEEFDRLSDAAQTELKNGLMEKYEYVVFLASTNKIHKIDEALMTRFTLVSKFETAQESDIIDKCKYILTNERISFTDEDLKYFVLNNKLKGIRTILNNLQLSCYMGVFEPKRTAFFIGDSGTEYDMVQWIKWYIGYLIQLPKQALWYLSYDLNQDQNIKKVRTTITETLLANYSLNYDYIFMELLKDDIFLPIKNCLNAYYQDIDSKRIKAMHFDAMLNEFITIFYTTKDIYTTA